MSDEALGFEGDVGGDGGFEPGLDESGGGEPAWFESLPEELQKPARAKGWKSPEDAIRAYATLESDASRLRNQYNGLVEAFQTAETDEPSAGYGGMPQNPYGGGQSGDPMEVIGRLAAAVDNGEVGAGEAMMAAMAQIVPALVEQQVSQRVNPVSEKLTKRELNETASSVRQRFVDAFGDDSVFQEIGREAMQFIRPGSFYDSPEGLRAAVAQAFMERELQDRRQRRRASSAETLNSSSRVSRQQAQAAEAFKQFLMGGE